MSLPDEFADAFGAFAGVAPTTQAAGPSLEVQPGLGGPSGASGAGTDPDPFAGAPGTEGFATAPGVDAFPAGPGGSGGPGGLGSGAATAGDGRSGPLAPARAPQMGPDAEDLPPLDRPDLPDLGPGSGPGEVRDLRLLSEVQVELAVELGRVKLPLRELLALGPGAVLELDRPADAPVDVLVNGCLVARGEVVVIDGEFGVRVTAVVQR